MCRAHQNLFSMLVRCGLSIALVVAIIGCGAKGSVTGKATYNNTPLPRGTTITFIGKSDRAFSTEVKTDDGTYTIEGLPRDDYKVTVKPNTSAAPIGGGGHEGGKPGGKKDKSGMGPGEAQVDVIKPPEGLFDPLKAGNAKGGFRIPSRYSDKDSTTISITVKSGKQEFPITLTD